MDDAVKQRHGCLTAWLIFVIVANSLTAIATPLSLPQIRQTIPNFPVWVAYVIPVLAVLNVVFAIALFKWKKWGFLGFVATTIFAFFLNLYAGLGIAQSLLGLLGVVILYVVLQIGGEKKGWTQLE